MEITFDPSLTNVREMFPFARAPSTSSPSTWRSISTGTWVTSEVSRSSDDVSLSTEIPSTSRDTSSVGASHSYLILFFDALTGSTTYSYLFIVFLILSFFKVQSKYISTIMDILVVRICTYVCQFISQCLYF